MEQTETDTTRFREIHFTPLHPEPAQAQSAMLLLSDVPGITHLELISEQKLSIGYDLKQISLRMIEQALTDVGFHLDNNLLLKIKRALHYYTEDVQRENLGCPAQDSNSTQQVFISRYQRLKHGCRDQRPDHWRRYL